MDDSYIEKPSFKKYYLIYVASMVGAIGLLFVLETFFFELSSSMGTLVTIVAIATTSTSYIQDVKRKMTKAERKKMAIGTFFINLGFSSCLSGAILITAYNYDPNNDLFKMLSELSAGLLIGISVGIISLYFILHIFGYWAFNNYKEPKQKK